MTTRHAGERKEQGLALRQERCGCSRFSSFLHSFWSLCFSLSAAASNFVDDSNKNFQKKGFPESLFCRFLLIQPGVPTRNPNVSETIAKKSPNPYRPDTGPLLTEKLFFLVHVARPRWPASKRKTWQGSQVSWMSCWNWKWKVWKRSFRTASKGESGRCENDWFFGARFPQKLHEHGRCENEAFVRDETPLKNWKWKMWNKYVVTFVRDVHQKLKVEDVKMKLSSIVVVVIVVVVKVVVVTVVGDSGGCDVIMVVVLVMATVPWRKWLSRSFAWLCSIETAGKYLIPCRKTIRIQWMRRYGSSNLKDDNTLFKIWWLGTTYYILTVAHVQKHLVIKCFRVPIGKNVAPTEIHKMAGAPGTGVVRQWMVLGKTTGSRCVAALIGVGYSRLHSAFHGKVDMRHNCFGFASWQSFTVSSLSFIPFISHWQNRA